MISSVQSPANIDVAQKTHLQVCYQRLTPSTSRRLTAPDTSMKPEMIGPMDGPANGLRQKIPNFRQLVNHERYIRRREQTEKGRQTYS
jgi:hypothetical protein